MSNKSEISTRNILVGALVGAAIGAVSGVLLQMARTDVEQERFSNQARNYLPLLSAMFVLAKQTSKLISGKPT